MTQAETRAPGIPAPPASPRGPSPRGKVARRALAAWRIRAGNALPLLVIWVPLLLSVAHVIGFTVWTTWLSFTPSDLLPEYSWGGLRSYWAVTRAPNTRVAYTNLVIYGVCFVTLT